VREGANGKFARRLRTNMTDAERCLWRHLRLRQLAGCRFRRQHPFGPYLLDFACVERRLVIELDGGQHCASRDGERDAWIRAGGFVIVRFWNNDVLNRTQEVLEQILEALGSPSPHPNLPPQAGEGEKA
jgi:very-short-patch-repair endonuclease